MTDRGMPIAPMQQPAGSPARLTATALSSRLAEPLWIDELDHRLQGAPAPEVHVFHREPSGEKQALTVNQCACLQLRGDE